MIRYTIVPVTRRHLGVAAFTTTTCKAPEWRQQQLSRLEKKFQEPLSIESDEELQPMWKAMESRVVNRKLLTKEQRGEKMGRTNIRPSDEEAWLQAGLYDKDDAEKKAD